MTERLRSDPAEGLLDLEGESIRALTIQDIDALRRLRDVTPAELFALPGSVAELGAFIEGLGKKAWSMPMICSRDGEPVGLCLMSMAQLKNLNAYLVALFAEPASSTVSLALYMRHAFWSYPLHRLYTQLPVTPALRPHAELFARAGFMREGVLVKHVAAPDGPIDAESFGLVRGEFDEWCTRHRPELSLT
jgi:RimJ/RimL family protein N-acetyltransferase